MINGVLRFCCSSLTSLKYQDGRFENASVEFDEAKLAPTYRLMWGIPGRSNALNIAARLGLNADIIADARERMGTAQVCFELMQADLLIVYPYCHAFFVYDITA